MLIQHNNSGYNCILKEKIRSQEQEPQTPEGAFGAWGLKITNSNIVYDKKQSAI